MNLVPYTLLTVTSTHTSLLAVTLTHKWCEEQLSLALPLPTTTCFHFSFIADIQRVYLHSWSSFILHYSVFKICPLSSSLTQTVLTKVGNDLFVTVSKRISSFMTLDTLDLPFVGNSLATSPIFQNSTSSSPFTSTIF